MFGRSHKEENNYQKNLKNIAKMAYYQPIASIPQPSQDFNYTLVRNRYSDYYENPKVVRKSNPIKPHQQKLTTILETHGRSPLFPKIAHGKNVSGQNILKSASKRKIKRLRSHFKKQHETTVTSRQKSLTINTRLDSQEQNRNQNINDLLESKLLNDIPKSLGFQTAEREHLHSNSSELSSIISRRRYKQPYSQSAAVSVFQQNQIEEQESDEQEFDKNAVPGPGSYDFNYSMFDKKRSTRSTNVSFLSKLTRFNYSTKIDNYPPQNAESPEEEKNNQKKIAERPKKKHIPFNSQSPRNLQFDELAKKQVPGPQNYYPRLGMEQDLIRNIQRHFKGNFGSNEPRFISDKNDNPHLGPGYYAIPNQEDPLQGQNFYFKSNKSRFPS